MNELILVEGTGDQDFIGGILNKIGKTHVNSYPPRYLGGPSNGINNVLKTLPVLLKKIEDGSTTRAAVLVDADYTSHNAGFAVRRQQITDILAAAGYVIPSVSPPSQVGEVFAHPDGRASVALFILPNHKDDGMIEDVLKNMVTNTTYSSLLQHADATVATLPTKLFNTAIHTSKAELGTFMAWQKKPPGHVGACVKQDIFDVNSPAVVGLIQWLNVVFP